MTVNVSEVVDDGRFNAFHLRVAMVCGALIFFDGFDLNAMSYAAPEFIKAFGITRPMIAPVFSAGLLGLAVGALSFGFIADRIGAKRTFLFCGAMFGIFSIATALSGSLTSLLVWRFLAGLALGGASPVSVAIASDYVPKQVRASVTMIMYIGLALGGIAAGYAYGFASVFGWRTVF